MKLKELRIEHFLTAKELAKKSNTDESMISRFENGKCLPTPAIMNLMCQALECTCEDIYSSREISFADSKKKRMAANDEYKLTVRLPSDFKNLLPTMCKEMGYANITDFILHQIVKLTSQYQVKVGRVTGSPESIITGK